MTMWSRLAAIVLFGVLCIGFVAFCDSRQTAAHPEDRPNVSSFSHAHPKTDKKWEHCHDHHYDASGLIDDHAGHYAPDFERGNFCPHGVHATAVPEVTATPTRQAVPPSGRPPSGNDDRQRRSDRQSPVEMPQPTPVPMPTPVPVPPQPTVGPLPQSREAPGWAVDLIVCGAPGFAWNHLGEVHTIAEGLVIGLAESCAEAALLAIEWMLIHLHRPAGAPLPGEALDLGEHGCPGWLWSGDGLWVHPIEPQPTLVLGPAGSLDDAIAMIAASLGIW